VLDDRVEDAVFNIIGFAVPSGEAASLQAVSAAGGGRFVNAGTDREVDATVARIREDGRKAKNHLVQSGAVARNRLAASGAAAKARICAGGLVAKERIAVSAAVAKKRIAGKDVAFEERAEKILASAMLRSNVGLTRLFARPKLTATEQTRLSTQRQNRRADGRRFSTALPQLNIRHAIHRRMSTRLRRPLVARKRPTLTVAVVRLN